MKVIYPGTFDPPTNGHLDIMCRAASMFETVLIVIAVNTSKESLFSPDERFEMVAALAEDLDNVEVYLWRGLVVKFAEKLGVRVLVRGVRALTDFNYEFELSLMNKALNPKIETIFLPTDRQYVVLRSSWIKEMASFNGDISAMVPPIVADALSSKFGGA